MSEFPSPEKETKKVEEKEQSDDEDDFECYFLEPAGNVNMAEKVAEANKKLKEESNEEEDENRPRKVQFNDQLEHFEPNDYSDDDCIESAQSSVIFEDNIEIKKEEPEPTEIPKTVNNSKDEDQDKVIPEEISEEAKPNIFSQSDIVDENPKFILVLLPREQNSSCESIIGEEISEEETRFHEKETKSEPENLVKPKTVRPKSAKKHCEISKISPLLSYSVSQERRCWQKSRNSLRVKGKVKNEKKNIFTGEIKVQVQIKGKLLKKINIDSLFVDKESGIEELRRCGSSKLCRKTYSSGGERPNTAPTWRTCCVIKTELPKYNGFRSEYGLSAEQLEERKQRALEIKEKKKQDQMKKKQEDMRRKIKSEENFQKWLLSKTQKTIKKKKQNLIDSLTRSDVYIRTHASYAANSNVPYSLDFGVNKKFKTPNQESRAKHNKTIVFEKLIGNMVPRFKKSFNIYLGTVS